MRPPSFWNFFGIAQELDELLHFILCFLDAGDILERDLVLVPGKHARLRFAEIEGAFPGHADLLAEQEVKHEQEKRDGEEPDHGLRKHVRLRLDRRLNARCREFFLQISGES